VFSTMTLANGVVLRQIIRVSVDGYKTGSQLLTLHLPTRAVWVITKLLYEIHFVIVTTVNPLLTSPLMGTRRAGPTHSARPLGNPRRRVA